MAAGLREKGDGDEHARAREEAALDGQLERGGCATGVAHGGDASFEGGAGVGHAVEHRERGRRHQAAQQVVAPLAGKVNVAINQAGQHGLPAGFDHSGIARDRHAGAGAKRGDALALDDDGRVVYGIGASAVNQADAGDGQRALPGPPRHQSAGVELVGAARYWQRLDEGIVVPVVVVLLVLGMLAVLLVAHLPASLFATLAAL